jgi:hypothetical protein
MGFFRAAWFIARTDVAFMIKRRETVLWTFVMPIVFFYFIGTVTGGFGSSDTNPPDPIALRAPVAGGFLVDEIVRRIEAQHYKVTRPATDAEFQKAQRRLTIPAPPPPYATFTDAILAGSHQTILFEHQSNSADGNYDQVKVARAVYEVVADLAVVKMDGGSPTTESFAALAAAPRHMQLSVTSAGRRLIPPSGFAQAVPGTLVMFTMLVLLTTGAVTLVLERDQGLLRRLASAPLPTGAVVLGKWGGRMMLGLVQIAFAMLAGSVLFHMQWGPSLPMVALVLVGWAAFVAGLAIVLANVTRTPAQTTGIGVFATQILAALGGCWWPIEITPPWMQKLAKLLPTGWAMDAMHKLVSFGDPAAAAIPHVVAMTVGALALGWIGARVFKYQ